MASAPQPLAQTNLIGDQQRYRPQLPGTGVAPLARQAGALVAQIAAKKNEADVNAAFTNAQNELRVFLLDPEQGIYSRKAGAAEGSTEQTSQFLQGTSDKYTKDMNRVQQDAFGRMWNQVGSSTMNRVAGYQLQQLDNFEKGTFAAMSQQAQDGVVQFRKDPDAVANQLEVIAQSTRALYEGQSSTFIDRSIQEAQSSAIVAGVEEFLQDADQNGMVDTESAVRMFSVHSDKLDPAIRGDVLRALNVGIDRNTAITYADFYMDKPGWELSDVMEALASQTADKQVTEMVRSIVDSRLNNKEQDWNQQFIAKMTAPTTASRADQMRQTQKDVMNGPTPTARRAAQAQMNKFYAQDETKIAGARKAMGAKMAQEMWLASNKQAPRYSGPIWNEMLTTHDNWIEEASPTTEEEAAAYKRLQVNYQRVWREKFQLAEVSQEIAAVTGHPDFVRSMATHWGAIKSARQEAIDVDNQAWLDTITTRMSRTSRADGLQMLEDLNNSGQFARHQTALQVYKARFGGPFDDPTTQRLHKERMMENKDSYDLSTNDGQRAFSADLGYLKSDKDKQAVIDYQRATPEELGPTVGQINTLAKDLGAEIPEGSRVAFRNMVIDRLGPGKHSQNEVSDVIRGLTMDVYTKAGILGLGRGRMDLYQAISSGKISGNDINVIADSIVPTPEETEVYSRRLIQKGVVPTQSAVQMEMVIDFGIIPGVAEDVEIKNDLFREAIDARQQLFPTQKVETEPKIPYTYEQTSQYLKAKTRIVEAGEDPAGLSLEQAILRAAELKNEEQERLIRLGTPAGSILQGTRQPPTGGSR